MFIVYIQYGQIAVSKQRYLKMFGICNAQTHRGIRNNGSSRENVQWGAVLSNAKGKNVFWRKTWEPIPVVEIAPRTTTLLSL
jgi:hypothetical protein